MSKDERKFTVMVVEDNDGIRDAMAQVAAAMGLEVTAMANAESALQHNGGCDILITDHKLPGKSGLELLRAIKEKTPETEAMLITAYGSIELAVEAMQSGASDFITKPFSPEELELKLSQLIDRRRLKGELERLTEERAYLQEEMDLQFNFGEIVGTSPAMQSVFRTIEKVARGDSSVIIYGESGTGKELVARAIHKSSPRSGRPFVRVNCGALAEGVLESELFGHEKGAFTGALRRKKGRFELADSGTIFLDEIGDIPLNTQVKLLRVLQEREFERVGGEETLSIDVRILAATNKNLKDEIKRGNFREDLFYRLHIIPIYLPPLRERREDIPALAGHFIKKTARALNLPKLQLSDNALSSLTDYTWPGNIREFENIIERAAVLCDDQIIKQKDLPLFGAAAEAAPALVTGEMNLNRALESLEKQMIEKALEEAAGVKTEAARLLGVKTSALYYKLEKYGLL